MVILSNIIFAILSKTWYNNIPICSRDSVCQVKWFNLLWVVTVFCACSCVRLLFVILFYIILCYSYFILYYTTLLFYYFFCYIRLKRVRTLERKENIDILIINVFSNYTLEQCIWICFWFFILSYIDLNVQGFFYFLVTLYLNMITQFTSWIGLTIFFK